MSGHIYYTPTSCGAASFLTAHIAGVPCKCDQVDLRAKKVTRTGADFFACNPKGNVPCVVLPDGTVLNENSATLQYIADQDASHKLLPVVGTTDRYLVVNALSYIGTELHQTVGVLFNPALPGAVHQSARSKIVVKWTYLNDNMLHQKKYLVGNKMSVADLYLYVVLYWSGHLKLDFSSYPNITAFYENMKSLPEVQAGHAAMASNPETSA